jgi:hypothetical protein
MDKIVGPGQVFFFGEGSNIRDMIGITARCHLYLAPPKCLDNLNLSDGPLGFAPQVLFQGQRFVSSDWLTGTFPETRKDVKKMKAATKKVFRAFRKTEDYRECASKYEADNRGREVTFVDGPELPPFTTAGGKQPESHPGIDALLSMLFDFDTIMRDSPPKIM